MGPVVGHPAADLQPPEPVNPSHKIAEFQSTEPSLNDWLQKRAWANQVGNFSRTFVAATATGEVAGYYTLATGAVQRAQATKRLQRNAPDPIPVMVLGRLAVSQDWEGRGVGSGLLRDALLRTLSAGEIGGIAAILVHAISQKAAGFYSARGFMPSPLHPLTLMLPLSAVARELQPSSASR